VPIWRLQTWFCYDSNLPRDRMYINPVFDDHGISSDPQGLCDELCAALDTWAPGTTEVGVRAYDCQGTKPVFHQGEKILNAGAFTAASTVREVSLCLSFYATHNRPRRRGRVYAPGPCLGTAPTLRPTTTHMTKVAGLAPIFQDLGGLDVDWSVYSAADNDANPVTHWYVDDEWDIQRRRGLRPTTRQAGTTSEA
jgi:hypothetical protein